MARGEGNITTIARLTAKRFPSLSATGINVYELVSFIMAQRNRLERSKRQKIGDDARDYINTSYFLQPLSNKALAEINYLGRNDIHNRLRQKSYPFSRLDRKTRETLLRLPNSWVHGAADYLLDARKLKKSSRQVRILAG